MSAKSLTAIKLRILEKLRIVKNGFASKLHRRAQHPRREFGAAEIKTLALGRLARRGLQHQFEDALAALLHGFLAVEDGAAIDVHVVFHAPVHRRGQA